MSPIGTTVLALGISSDHRGCTDAAFARWLTWGLSGGGGMPQDGCLSSGIPYPGVGSLAAVWVRLVRETFYWFAKSIVPVSLWESVGGSYGVVAGSGATPDWI